MRHTWILFFLLLGFFSCDEDKMNFETSTEGLEIKFTPVAGGAMMYYTLPNNSDIFGMNVRYINSQGREILKSCGYGGDSLLLDGFTRAQDGIKARISFTNHRKEESKSLDYQFKTLDSAPWIFFENVEVNSSWHGFQVSYKSPSVVTGMVHVFYLGTNPLTHEEDTILVKSFPISRNGGTENFVVKQGRGMYTVILRTEDFQGYRVRQEIYPNIDAFLTEQWQILPANFNDFGLSVENDKAKTGKKYLFDGELKGKERLIASAIENVLHEYTEDYATYLAGPNALGKPIVIDLREEKTPAKIRMYSLISLPARHPYNSSHALGTVWDANYEDKLPCNLKVYGNKESSDPNSGDWVYLGELAVNPAAEPQDRWSYPTAVKSAAPRDLTEFAEKDPIYVDVDCPPIANTYRYLKIIVNDTYRRAGYPETVYNTKGYFTLHELEVFVKKD